MDREAIEKILPHRGPMLLLDDAYVDADGVCHASFTIPEDPFYCQGHFPGNPIVPGVILCEIMAQSCGILLEDVLRDHLLLYRGLDEVKFRGTVRPGDRCEITARLSEQRNSLTRCEAALSVAGRRCCQAVISLAAVAK